MGHGGAGKSVPVGGRTGTTKGAGEKNDAVVEALPVPVPGHKVVHERQRRGQCCTLQYRLCSDLYLLRKR